MEETTTIAMLAAFIGFAAVMLIDWLDKIRTKREQVECNLDICLSLMKALRHTNPDNQKRRISRIRELLKKTSNMIDESNTDKYLETIFQLEKLKKELNIV